MNIPESGKRRTSGASRASHHSQPSSYIDGLASSLRRASGFEAVDTRQRRNSSRASGSPGDNLEANGRSDAAVSRPYIYKHLDRQPSAIDEEAVVVVDETSALLPSTGVDERHPSRALSDIYDQDVLDLVLEAKSTLAQTIFNIINLLIGIGLLSLPLAIKHAGWVLGILFLMIGAVITAYTAILLARSLETSDTAYAYSDIAALAYGPAATVATAIIFMLELLAAGSALVILFGDNFNAVVPQVSSLLFKIICFIILLPAALLPLRILSYTSAIGILSTLILIGVIFFDGLYKTKHPGSLRDPMPTEVLPGPSWPLAIGLLMSGFGGHGIMPQIYRDMQNRRDFPKAVIIAYLFSCAICLFVAVIGYLMFGEDIQAEVTVNLLRIKRYPRVLNQIAVLMTAITSVTKAPLAIKSISANIDIFFGLKTLREERTRGPGRVTLYVAIRSGVNFLTCMLAILVPSFDRIMSVLGSAFVFLISVILPVIFYMRIMQSKLTIGNRLWLWGLVAISTVLALIGTVWAFLPMQNAMP
ncbi:transmembrane amino acid transporter protein-domain-containing protein [Protomyces lactucae-debilis]|uniref:Transmembrane amino acid transporter protein-domain-containing protein n=1 Tax=Protomyces lactucae-debilis TaxID=2754530 RepID=A0A1Y2F3T7_PROLT|nr:transmembrane amino acid transporter protein-domain-containing protein [Protomyces lactucae-debilis]ORY78570.1 transmembrane amino acid transporter protein-domain-containing protein [Protomyces lactucae-debilis]